MKTTCFFLLGLIFTCGSLQAQKETSTWFFGANAGLKFNSTGAPSVLTSGQVNTAEGVATISDANGNLLFYTDGITLYDRLHTPMPNGQNLGGDPSSSQSAIIVKHPGNSNEYFVFTVDAYGEPNGLKCHVVDMNANLGRGNVITARTVTLLNPCTEKITAVRHCNGTDVWVVTHLYGTDQFNSYLVSAAGLNTTPVVSFSGTAHTQNPGGNNTNSIGYLRASLQGNKIALGVYGLGLFEVFDFNKSTGAVSNAVNLGTTYTNAYGVEFSPNGELLYCAGTDGERTIYQFDLTAGSASAIVSSRVSFSTPQNIGALQLGPDYTIYVAQFLDLFGSVGSQFLGVIRKPDTRGTGCDFTSNGINLGAGRSRLGLPNFRPSLITPKLTDVPICQGDCGIIGPKSPIANATSWSWTPTAGLNNPSIQNPTTCVNGPASYTLNVSTSDGCSFTFLQNVTIKPFTPTEFVGEGGFNTINTPILRGDFKSGTNKWKQITGDADIFDSEFQNCLIITNTPNICSVSPVDINCMGIPCNHFGQREHRQNTNPKKYAGIFSALSVGTDIEDGSIGLEDIRVVTEGLEYLLDNGGIKAGKKYTLSFWVSKAEKGETGGNLPLTTGDYNLDNLFVNDFALFNVKLSNSPTTTGGLPLNLFQPTVRNTDFYFQQGVADGNWQKQTITFIAPMDAKYLVIEGAPYESIYGTSEIPVYVTDPALYAAYLADRLRALDKYQNIKGFQSYFYIDDISLVDVCENGPAVSARKSVPPARAARPAFSHSLNIYPNPATGTSSIEFALDKPARVELRVLDITGKLVAVQSFDSISTGTMMLEVGERPRGIYFCQLWADNSLLATQKLVVMY